MRLPLSFIGLAVLLGACTEKSEPVAPPIVVRTDAKDLARLKAQYGDKLAKMVGVPEGLRNTSPPKPQVKPATGEISRGEVKAAAPKIQHRVKLGGAK
jgi:hypothetical protein